MQQGYTRRRFVQATVAAAALPGTARAARRRRRPTVAVFGGGVAGLSVAHELIERGFDVTVYERRAWGGKARSYDVPGSARDGRLPLPGEHAYRAEFGCYQNIPALMRRTPFEGSANGTFDNMVECPGGYFTFAGKPDLPLPLTTSGHDTTLFAPEQITELIRGVGLSNELPPEAAAFFARRMAVFLSSCDERRSGQWEKTSWVSFIGADRFGPDYMGTLGQFPRFIQASKPENTGATFIANVCTRWLIYPLLGRGTNGPVLRMLNRPTNEVWIDPWTAELRRLGARLKLGHEVRRLHFARGRITGADVHGPRGRARVRADWYVSAMPMEWARRLWTPGMLAADARLRRMRSLRAADYVGISYYLTHVPDLPHAILAGADSPWAANGVTQSWLWSGIDIAQRYGDGTVHEKLSMVVADWNVPGIVYGKPAHQLSREQIAHDFWEQIKAQVNDAGSAPVLTDEMLHSWSMDPGMQRRHGRWHNTDPLVLPSVDTERLRPDPDTNIPNLVLCGDYLKGEWDVASMEAACFNGRRAAGVIARATNAEPVEAVPLYAPPEWEPARAIDRDRWRAGQPNLLDG